jgi:large subunit ribosomal protein L17
MFRNMVTSLFKYDRIRTTDAKAKEIRRWADQLVTLAKRGDLHARRQAMAIIREKDVVHKLFAEAPKRFADVNGGYTRVVKMGFRPGDAAPVSLVELVTPEPKKKKKPRRRKKSAPKTETPKVTAVETPAEEKDAAPPEAIEADAATDSTVEETDVASSEAVAAAEDGSETSATPAEPVAAEESEVDDKKEEK